MIGHLFLEAASQHTFSFSFFLPHVSPFLSERTDGVCVCLSVCVCVNVSMSGVNVSVFISLSLSHTHTPQIYGSKNFHRSKRGYNTPPSLSMSLSLSLSFVRASLSLKHKHRHTHPHILSRFVCVRGIDLSICISIHIYGLHRSVKYIFTSTNEWMCVFWYTECYTHMKVHATGLK